MTDQEAIEKCAEINAQWGADHVCAFFGRPCSPGCMAFIRAEARLFDRYDYPQTGAFVVFPSCSRLNIEGIRV